MLKLEYIETGTTKRKHIINRESLLDIMVELQRVLLYGLVTEWVITDGDVVLASDKSYNEKTPIQIG